MMGKRQSLLVGDEDRMTVARAIELTAESLRAYATAHPDWVIAFSGGKDSAAVLSLVCHLVATGDVPAPRSLRVLYADTRQELPYLHASAMSMLEKVRSLGFDAEVVLPPIDKRFFVYILGRGVPPPNNNTLRWCTRQIKVDPMSERIQSLSRADETLVLTGVRLGESAARDQRIAVSCSKDGGECGQGWFQQMPESVANVLAPILHWRVCNVWDWLKILAPSKRYGEWDTSLLANVYGGDEAEEMHARTGCVGCPLAERETALDYLIAHEADYLSPLKELKPIYRELRKPGNRLRKPAGERNKNGKLAKGQCRMGPLRLEVRLEALKRVLEIQARVSELAHGKPEVCLINTDEEARIRELIAAKTFPRKWSGDEPHGDELYEQGYADGTIQPLLFQ